MPQVTPERVIQLLAATGKSNKAPCVVLAGQDSYLRDLSRKGIIAACFPDGAPDWAVIRASVREEGLDRVLSAAQSYPMLSPRQVVFALDFESVDDLDDDARDAARKQLEAYLDDPAPFTVLVLESASLDQRTKISKLLDEKALIVSLDLGDDVQGRVRMAVQAVNEMARSAGATIEPAAAAHLADCLNGALERIAPEVAKLATYAGAGKCITLADVNALVLSAKSYTVWQLGDMFGSGDRRRALTFLDALLRDGEEPVRLVGGLAWMYRKLIEALELPPGMNSYAAAGRLRMQANMAEQAQRQARAIGREKLLRGLQALAEADLRLKSSAPPSIVLEVLIAELTATKPTRAA